MKLPLPPRIPLFILLMTAAFHTAVGEDGAWRETTWQGENAWQSEQGRWRAIVSTERCRLVYLGEKDDEKNLLHVPPGPRPEVKGNTPTIWGGHLFWLGPQSLWNWPPPADWEFSPASKVAAHGDELELEHPATDAAYPALRRRYSWTPDGLRCEVRWERSPLSFFGIHVVQISKEARIDLGRKITPALPHGFAIFGPKEVESEFALPQPGVEVAGDMATLRFTDTKRKVAFPPQSIRAELGRYALTLSRGPISGLVKAQPDLGLTTQAYLGGHNTPFIEIEQVSPVLEATGEAGAGFAVFLKPEFNNQHGSQ